LGQKYRVRRWSSRTGHGLLGGATTAIPLWVPLVVGAMGLVATITEGLAGVIVERR
jgi:hypothetical protein